MAFLSCFAEDVYTCLMKHAPTKEVPVGSNHQADVPEYVEEEILDRGALERKLVGKCIIPMPESDVCDVVGQGRKECLCLDKGSVRCVRLHVMEARERLIKAIGYERFRELGFCELFLRCCDKYRIDSISLVRIY